MIRELGARRQELDRERRQTLRRLGDATRALDGLGLLGRARHGPRLRAQAIEQRAALSRIGVEIARVERELQAARAQALAAYPRTRERARGLDRSRGRGLELGL